MATLLLVLIYVAFISLGLPDALLGAVWPVMQPELSVPYGFAGILSMIVSGGTILSSVFSSRLLSRFGTGKVTAVSVALTAVALLGFSFAPSFWWLTLLAVPLGLGAGSVDAGLNAFVAAHYESRHMSWLHCFWGVGALTGPLVLSALLARGMPWRLGYRSIGIFQCALVAILFISLPLWARAGQPRAAVSDLGAGASPDSPPASLRKSGLPFAFLTFFLYCGIESTMGLWGGSFLVKSRGLNPAAAASWVSVFYASITLGRFLTGFITRWLTNNKLIRLGGLIILAGVALMLLPLPNILSLVSFTLIGLGCAPIYPCMLHETPVRFGQARAQQVMGYQMAVAYVGSTFLPPLFGFIAAQVGLWLLPCFLLAYVCALLYSSETLRRKTAGK